VGWRSWTTSPRYILVRLDLIRPAHEQTAVLFGQHRSPDSRASCSFDDGATQRTRYRAGVGSTGLGRRDRSLSGQGSGASSAISGRSCAAVAVVFSENGQSRLRISKAPKP